MLNIRKIAYWAYACFAVAAFVIVSATWIDRPVSLFLLAHIDLRSVFLRAHADLPILLVVAGICVVGGGAYWFWRRQWTRAVAACTTSGLALLISAGLVGLLLKPLFGRVVPCVFLSGGGYGFHWLHSGDGFASFPSGHSAQMVAVLSVLWTYYPRMRWAYFAIFVALAFSLIVGQWHFLSDTVAGAFVGALVGQLTILGVQSAKKLAGASCVAIEQRPECSPGTALSAQSAELEIKS